MTGAVPEPELGRHSSSWAVRKALQLRGFEPPTEALLFGLGGSPWYCFTGQGRSGVLRGLHPDRIKHGFYALNIWSVRFRDLSGDAADQLRARADQGLQTLVLVDRRRLVGQEPIVDDGADHALVVTGASADGGPLWVQGPTDAEPWPVPEGTLRHAWFRPQGGTVTATYFWHPVVELRWSSSHAVRRALRRISHQLTHGHPTLGQTGLPGLAAFADRVAAGDTAALASTARLAVEDGGECFHRDLTADFLRLAEQELGVAALGTAADCFARSAAVWRELLVDFETPPYDTHRLRLGLDEILRHERAACAHIGSVAMAGCRAEAPCLT